MNKTQLLRALLPIAALAAGVVTPAHAQGLGYARTLTTDGTTIDAANSLNPTGGAITSVRNSLGNYSIQYAGAIRNSAELVSALGSGAEYCKIGDSGGSANTYDARILCFDGTGAPTETRYSHMLLTRNNPQQISYAWIAGGTVQPEYSWTPTGQITSTRTGTGTYTVTFPGMAVSDHVQVTAYGGNNAYCYPVGWSNTVNVRCVNASNAAVDSDFEIAYVRASAQPGLGFMWVSTAESAAAAPALSPSYTYSSGGTVGVTRTGVGLYSIRFAGINPSPAPNGKGPAAQISGYGGSALRCSVNTITASGADLTVNVACFAAGGAAANGPFTLLVLPPQQQAALPAPTISNLVTTPNPPLAGPAFSFSITGTNFDPATVRVLFTSTSGGTACPAANPCGATLTTRTATSLVGNLALPAGTYSVSVANGAGTRVVAGTVTVAEPGGTGGAITLTPSSLAFQFRLGGAAPPAQTIQVPGRPAGSTAVRSFTVDFPGVPWLVATPASGDAPNGGSANVTVTVVTASLPAVPGTVSTTLRLRFPADSNAVVDVPVSVAVQEGGPTAPNTNQVLSHIADSDGWQTTIILMNPDADAAPFTLRFYGSQTTDRAPSAPLDLAFVGVTGRVSVLDGIIPGRGSRTIQTAGTDPALSMGWVELITPRRLVGSSVFRYAPDRQEAAVNLTTASRSFIMPFDNTLGRVTSFAIVNTNATQAIAVNVTVRDEGGATIGTTAIPLLARGHLATESNTRFPASADRRGTLEFTTTNADITGLGIRFDAAAPGPRPFTSFPVHPRP